MHCMMCVNNINAISNLWTAKDEDIPVVGTIASQFNDAGINELFEKIMLTVEEKTKVDFGKIEVHHIKDTTSKSLIIPPKRVRYLSEISESNKAYDNWVDEQCTIASKLYQLNGVIEQLKKDEKKNSSIIIELQLQYETLSKAASFGGGLEEACKKLIENWSSLQKKYSADFFEYTVRDKVIKQSLVTLSLSGTKIPKLVLPKYKDWGDILRWQLQENVPGEFPLYCRCF